MTTKQEIWDRLYEKAYKRAQEIFSTDNCDIAFGENTTISIIVTDKNSEEEAEFEIDVADYFNSVSDGFPDLVENLEDYVDLDELKEASADSLATQYADENIEEHEGEVDEEDEDEDEDEDDEDEDEDEDDEEDDVD